MAAGGQCLCNFGAHLSRAKPLLEDAMSGHRKPCENIAAQIYSDAQLRSRQARVLGATMSSTSEVSRVAPPSANEHVQTAP